MRVLFISPLKKKENHVAVGKRKVKTKKKEHPTTAQTSGVHNDQHRAVCTLNSTLDSSEDSCSLYTVYFSAFRRMRLTHSAVVSKAYVKRCKLNEETTHARKN